MNDHVGATSNLERLKQLAHFRLLAVDLPGHGLSDPIVFRRGHVREQARTMIDDILDGLQLHQTPVVGHSPP